MMRRFLLLLALLATVVARNVTPSLQCGFHPDYGDHLDELDDTETTFPALRITTAHHALQPTTLVQNTRSKAWPPWPFSMLQADEALVAKTHLEDDIRYRSAAAWLWTLTKVSVKVAARNVQYFGSQLWFHLPPATTPLLLAASWPRRQAILETIGGPVVETGYRTVVPLWSNPFARNMVLGGVALAIWSWADFTLQRQRRLTALPLSEPYREVHRAILPPFLPEEVPPLHFAAEDEGDEEEEEGVSGQKQTPVRHADSKLPRRLQEHWDFVWGKAPKPWTMAALVKDWQRMRQLKQRDRLIAKRLAVMDQLVAIQALKKQEQRRRKRKWGKKDANATVVDDLGYALVTGASRGIGRAIAVELARWEIPLILVARDLDRLTALAYDLEACYGVRCCVLQADLAKPGVAESIYRSTEDAGLKVDILVNNAGFSSQGLSMDLPIDEVDDMISLNVMAVSKLTHLYGKDMKERRRGRILMVSSICGAVAGIASVAVYSATKAFEATFGVSIAKELEPYGVGVTCLLPGAVTGTDFKARSNSEEALCWHIPGYPKTPPQVAKLGVQALLRGDTEVTIGWMNRVFLKVMKPILPQRIHNTVAEIMWNPLHLPFTKRRKASVESPPRREQEADDSPVPTPPSRPRYDMGNPPRLLKLEEVVPIEEPKDESLQTEPPASSDEAPIQQDQDPTTEPGSSRPAEEAVEPEAATDNKVEAQKQPIESTKARQLGS